MPNKFCTFCSAPALERRRITGTLNIAETPVNRSLQQKIEQLNHALGNLSHPAPVIFKSKNVVMNPAPGVLMQGQADLSEGKSNAELANSVDLLLHSIGCIKDHYDAFVEGNVGANKAKKLLGRSGSAAIVQDLWNRSKHGEINTSWSGKFPYLGPVQQAMSFDVRGIGESGWQPKPTRMALHAMVFAKDGSILGDLNNFIEEAVDEWEEFFCANGLSLIVR